MPTANSTLSGASSPLRQRASLKVGPYIIWEVKFWPYVTKKSDEPILAAVSSYAIYIYRLTDEVESGLVLLDAYEKPPDSRRDVDDMTTCTWCFVNPNEPLIATSGDGGRIQVWDVKSAKLFTTLVGHGMGTINELATHPKYPWIVASASLDKSVRIWDLRRVGKPKMSTCIIICGHGNGHKAGILSTGWHDSGRYLITGGFDRRVCVWTIPDLDPGSTFWFTISPEGRQRSSGEVHIIYYPHFTTSALHINYVDKVMFHGDMIISKASEEHSIVLWSITGFDSSEDPPDQSTAPKGQEHLETRNGFMRVRNADKFAPALGEDDVDERYTRQGAYVRHLEFNSPYCQSFYMRFGLSQPSMLFPDIPTVLSMGNTASQVRHWDLTRLRIGNDGAQARGLKKKASLKKGIARPLQKVKDYAQSESVTSGRGTESANSSRASSAALTPSDRNGREDSTETTSLASDIPRAFEQGRNRKKYPLHDSFTLLKEHALTDLADFKQHYFTARGVDWSLCGRWCVVVGESQGRGVMAVLDRPS